MWIAILNCVVILVIFVALGFVLFGERPYDSWSVVLTALVFTPPLFHAAFIILILRQYYPANDLARSYRISFRILAAIVILILVIMTIGVVDLIISIAKLGPISETISLYDAINIAILITLSFLFVSQIYMLFEGNWLLKKIRKNFRAGLLDSMQL